MSVKPTELAFPRIRRMRERVLNTVPEIFVDRALLVTEIYRRTQGQTPMYRRAMALKNVLENMQICIAEDELIVGSYAGRPRGCQVYPEYDLKFVVDELDSFDKRVADRFFVNDENKAALREIYDAWKGNSIADAALRLFSDEQKQYARDLVYALTALRSGVGHVAVDYAMVIDNGVLRIFEKVSKLREALAFDDPHYADKLDYYQSVEICLNSLITFAERFSRLAEEKAALEGDSVRARELLEIARICQKVPAHPAETFYEALQSFWFLHLAIHLEANGHSISPGRFDQYMYPYFRRDVNAGATPREFASELLQALWIKFFEMNKVRDKVMSVAFGGYPMFQNLIVGGQDTDGRSAVNELSHMILDTTYVVGLPQPSLSVRWFLGAPEDFLRHAMKVISQGTGLPALFNDEVLIPNMLQMGYNLEEARNYAIVGCTETAGQGNNEPWLTGGFLNTAKLLELTIFDGLDPVTGTQYALRTGAVEDMDFEALFSAFCSQTRYYLDKMVSCDNILDALHGKLCPTPLESVAIHDCLESGRTSLEGGARHNTTALQMVGVPNAIDSLHAIRQLIYEKKTLDWKRLKGALLSDFSGEEALRQRLLGLSKYGMDDDEVDDLGRRYLSFLEKQIETYRSPRGKFNVALYSIASHVLFGARTGATPDGRRKFQVVADGGVSCSHGSDREGLTALLNSVVKLDPYKARGSTLLNVKLSPKLFEGENFDKTLSAVKTYFLNKGQHIQFNVVDKEVLLNAQRHPENYPMLSVRVAGFSVLFTTIDPMLQNDIIARTEHDSRG
ncbi:MAG: formate C-acetyltransferase/glycerol dehydratase family glycyl radical enzyme [Clostridiales bacterium]|nr:formate C-acetyltransferase/glycerol dehydratase family glycyl radical enzyme [Clostridiales bacterium]